MNDDLAEAIGKAFSTLLQRENEGKNLTIAVGRDMRETSLPFQRRVIKGMVESGVNVIDIGLVSTPAFYFGVGHLGADGGLMVSASHNPPEYNGFKLVREKAIPVSGETGINTIADMIEQDDYIVTDVRGEVSTKEGIPMLFTKAGLEFAGDGEIKRFKIVADSANGMGAQYLEDCFSIIDADLTKMYWEVDGTFPNHEADPFKEKNLVDIKAKVKEVGADLGIATDGDGDRIFFIDETGERVEPGILRGLLSQIMLRRFPGRVICRDIRPGKITDDLIIEAGGEPCITKVGHSLIKEKMRSVDAVFGGESSGHFFYKFPTGTYEGPITVIAHLLQELTTTGKTLSELAAPYKVYFHSGEINFVVEDKVGMMETIKNTYSDGDLMDLDGITITYKDFWFNVRASNTESKLRLNLEAVDEKTMEQKRDELVKLIGG